MRNRIRPLLVALALALGAGAAAQEHTGTALPLLHDPNLKTPRQVLTPAERTEVQALADKLNARKEVQGIRTTWPYSEKPSVKNVLFSMTAPFRSATPERLTVFAVSEAEPPVFLFVLSGKNGVAADLIEPVGNMSLCMVQAGYTLRDINQNGQREVALVIGCGDGPGGGTTLHLFGYGKGSWQSWGAISATTSMGSDEPFDEVNTLYVQKGPQYRIYSIRRYKAWTVTPSDQRTLTKDTTTLVLVTPDPKDAWYKVRRLF